MAHEYQKTVRFGEADPAGIAYYPTILHYCHLTMEDFFEVQAGICYGKLIKERRVGFPVVDIQASFSKGMALGDLMTVRFTVPELGSSSVKMRCQFRNPAGEDCADILNTTVCVDMDRFSSQPVPEDLRTVLAAHAE